MEKNKNTIFNKIILTGLTTLALATLASTSTAVLQEIPTGDDSEVLLIDSNEVHNANEPASESGTKAYDKIKTYMMDIDSIEDYGENKIPGWIYTNDSYEGAFFMNNPTSLVGTRLLPEYKPYGGRGILPLYTPEGFVVKSDGSESTYTTKSADYRYSYMQKTRWNLSTKSWNAYMGGGVVYCGAYHNPIRWGVYDPYTYYIPVGSGTRTLNSEYITAPAGSNSLADIKNTIRSNITTWFNATVREEYYTNPGGRNDDSTAMVRADDKGISQFIVEYQGLPCGENNLGYVIYDSGSSSMLSYGYRAGMITSGAFPNRNEWLEIAEASAEATFDKMYNSRAGTVYATTWTDIKTGQSYNVTGTVGRLDDLEHVTEVMVLENENSTGYMKTDENDYENDMYSFIFSSVENAYMPEYAKRYSLEDIQEAYWELSYKHNNKKEPADEVISDNARKLTETAEKYERFIDKVDQGGYHPSIDTSKAQNISNFSEKQYVLGPYKLNYDDIEDVSYVKALTIEYGEGKTLYYGINGEKNEDKDFALVLEGDKGTKSNGMTNEYPKDGQNFYIIINADKIGYDTKTIKLHAIFEHVDTTKAHYQTFKADGNVYRYSASYLTVDYTSKKAAAGSITKCPICLGTHEMKHAKLKIYVSYYVCGGSVFHPTVYGTKEEEYDVTDYTWIDGEKVETGSHTETRTVTDYDVILDPEHYTYYNNVEKFMVDTLDVYIPYIKMNDHIWTEQDAQELTLIGDGVEENRLEDNAYREYKVVDVEVPKEIKLSIELGGYVWVDEEGGKEDVANGVYDQGEDKVSNLIVRLFKYGDEVFADRGGAAFVETKTDENGNYKFDNISPMYKYYIKFAYNGQYYEPTNYTSPYDSVNGWAKGNWQINSNAVDKKYEREEYNARFSTINSAPESYTSMQYDGAKLQTYTKMELLGYTLQGNGQYSPTPTFDDKGNVLPASSSAAIDKFGNILNGNSGMIKYVVDSLTTAYTLNPTNANSDDKNATFNYDYYPTPDIFVVDDHLNNRTVSRTIYNRIDRISRGIEAAMAEPKIESILYPTAYYINLGLKPRQEVDMALKKDVEKVTLEINNHVHEYTYDKLDTFKCTNGHTGKFTEARYEMNMETYRWDFYCPECGAKIEANWDITVRLSDGYYNEDYSRGIYKSDYIYKVSAYGYGDGITTPEEARNLAQDMFGKTQADELEIYVTYKIMVSNQSLSVRTRIDEIVDYYDNTYELVPERSYVEIYKNGEGEKHSIVLSDGSACGPSGSISDYKKTFIRGIGKNDDDSYYLGGGESAYFYVTFRVMKSDINGEQWLLLGEKGNIAEINGYSTIYEKGTKVPNIYPDGTPEGTKAGIVDMNSTPGNQTSKDEIRENDTDRAPAINIHLYDDDSENRVIEGVVWEDERTKDIKASTIADGLQDEKETTINGVTVQLVELMENGKEFIWREFGSDITGRNGIGTAMEGTKGDGTGSGMKETETPIINALDENGNPLVQDYVFDKENHNGRYAFKSFMPGNYVVRFKYGDTVRTALPQDLNVEGLTTDTLKGLNAKSYNGQDYKSTTYQTGIEQNKTYTWNQEPVKIVKENGEYRLWLGNLDTINNWEYGYVIWDGTKLVFSPEWDNKGQKQVAPKLTEVSTFKADASNNETVVLPTIEMVTAESLTTPVIDVNKQNGYLYDITKSDAAANVSDAKDIESRRNTVNDYSDNDVVNHEAEVLASHKSNTTDYGYTPTEGEEARKGLVEELIEKTQMTAETGLMVIEFEYDDIDTDIKDDPEYNRQGKYTIGNVNLGLEERPKAQLEIEKEITNVKLTLADSSILFDAKQSASNVLWNDHKDYKTGYTSDSLLGQHHFMDPDKYGNMDRIRTRNMAKFGLVQLTMDEELMHGATIKIDYKVTIRNIGEVDYYETYTLDTLNEDGTTKQVEKNRQNRLFYYTGQITDDAKVVTTKADEVMDYVANNLQFNVADNNVENSNKWQVKSNDEITEQRLVNTKLIADNVLNIYNTKIFTESLNAELVPVIYKDKVDNDRQDTTSIPLVLTQLITAENDTDDLTYRNIIEIVRISNKVGRRMEYSVVVNQDPVMSPAEIDTDLSETVRILPPFGETPIYIIISIIVITGVGILIPSIIFIIQKVLKR